MKNTTALQDLIEWMEDVSAPIGIIKQAKSLLQKEKEQIIFAFHDGRMNIVLKKEINPMNLYYDDKYKTI